MSYEHGMGTASKPTMPSGFEWESILSPLSVDPIQNQPCSQAPAGRTVWLSSHDDRVAAMMDERGCVATGKSYLAYPLSKAEYCCPPAISTPPQVGPLPPTPPPPSMPPSGESVTTRWVNQNSNATRRAFEAAGCRATGRTRIQQIQMAIEPSSTVPYRAGAEVATEYTQVEYSCPASAMQQLFPLVTPPIIGPTGTDTQRVGGGVSPWLTLGIIAAVGLVAYKVLVK